MIIRSKREVVFSQHSEQGRNISYFAPRLCPLVMSAIKLTIMAIVLSAIVAICKGKMAFKDQCLYWHNYFRTLHQVPPVTWSTSLQKEAEDWVKYLAENNKFQHSPHNPGNLYMAGYRPNEYCSDAIWWFHQEEKFYNYSSPGFVYAAGHFTQVIWRNSKRIGAAWAIRKDGRLVISIKYRPGGNYDGFFANNVFRPIAQTLDPEWGRAPPKRFRCPKRDIIATKTTIRPNITANITLTTIRPNITANISLTTIRSNITANITLTTIRPNITANITLTKPNVKAVGKAIAGAPFFIGSLISAVWLIV